MHTSIGLAAEEVVRFNYGNTPLKNTFCSPLKQAEVSAFWGMPASAVVAAAAAPLLCAERSRLYPVHLLWWNSLQRDHHNQSKHVCTATPPLCIYYGTVSTRAKHLNSEADMENVRPACLGNHQAMAGLDMAVHCLLVTPGA
eukprot:1158978-Pelagomonas_calceolata.AAC.6